MTWPSLVIPILAAALLRPLALAAAGWLTLRVLKVRHPASRHAVWAAVVIGMLLLPVLSLVSPRWTLPLRLRQENAAAAAPAAGPQPEFTGPGAGDAGNEPRLSNSRVTRWPSAAAAMWWCYFAGLLTMLIYRGMGLALVWRVRTRSKQLREGRLRESEDVTAPVVLGILHPAVILPAGWREWSGPTRRAVLAHEFAHLRRRDALIAALARLAECVYWFHPLAWLLSRKIAELSEQACDAAVLARTDDPAGYSRILLEFAHAVNAGRGGVALPGLTMVAESGLQRRIDSLFELAAAKHRKLAHPRLVLALVGIPMMGLTTAVGLTAASELSAAAPAAADARQAASETLTEGKPLAPAAEQADPAFLTGLGNVIAAQTVKIRPRIDGQLLAVYKEGAAVQKGDLLATIDARPYQLQLEQARGQLAQDQAAMANARSELARDTQLASQNAIAKQQLDGPRAAVLQLEGKMKVDQALVELAELQISYTQITSPINGIAGLRIVDPGNTVHAADTGGILVVTQLQPIAVLFTLPEGVVPQIQAMLRESAKPVVEAWNRDYSARIATGRLEALDNEIDVTTGTAKLKAVFENRDGALFPNQFVNVRLMLGAK